MIPVLETARLKLRAHKLEDLPLCIEMWSDPEVLRYTIRTQSTPQRTWMRVLSYIGHWSLLGYGYWAIEEKASGKYIGELGFADFKRDLKPSIDGFPEAGWALMPKAHGKGYATEALKAAIEWGDRNFKTKTVCLISPENPASIRLAKKCGYVEYARTQKEGEAELLLSRESKKS